MKHKGLGLLIPVLGFIVGIGIESPEAIASPNDSDNVGAIVLLSTGIAAGVAYVGTSIASTVINSLDDRKGKASKGWVTVGRFFGYTNIAVGAISTFIALGFLPLKTADVGYVVLGGGLGFLAMGIFGLVYANQSARWLAGSARPGIRGTGLGKRLAHDATSPPRFMISPTLLRESGGSLVPGVSLSVVAF